MEIGLSTSTFFTRELTENSIKIIEDLGFPVAEIFLSTFSEYLPEFGDLLAERKGKTLINSIHTLNQQFEPELFNKTPRTRSDCEFFFKQAAVVAKKVGASYYTFHGPAMLRGRKYNTDFNAFGKRVDELCDMLSEFGDGCVLTYENVSWAHFCKPEFFEKLKETSSKVGACLDIKQAMQSGYNAIDFLPAVEGRLKTVHISDYDQNGRILVPGKGIFNYIEFFAGLIDINFDGNLIIELYPDNYKSYDEIIEGREYLKTCLKKAERIGI